MTVTDQKVTEDEDAIFSFLRMINKFALNRWTTRTRTTLVTKSTYNRVRVRLRSCMFLIH